MRNTPTASDRQRSWLEQQRLLFTHVLPTSLLCLTFAACGTQTSNVSPTAAAAVATAPPVTTAAPAVAPTLQAARDAFANAPLTLTFATSRWQPHAEELGATVDAASDGLRVTVDQHRLRSYLDQLTPAIGTPAVDAAIVFSDGTLRATPEQIGTTLDRENAASAVTAALQRAVPNEIKLTTKPLAPTVDDAAAAAAISQAQQRLNEPLVLTVGTKTFSWNAETLAPLLTFAPDGNGKLTVALDRSAVANQLTALANNSGQPAQEPRVAWNGGQLQITVKGQDGFSIDQAKAVEVILRGFAQGNKSISLPLQMQTPQVTATNLNALGIREPVSVGKSDFTGSAAYRITNIIAGMKLLNGVLIAPGAEFSFNGTVGDIDERNGFVKGHAIVNNRTQIEFGGGICQDSTTVFRAAFWAGLPITDRKEHRFYISWYNRYGFGEFGDGPGLDATIYTGVQDFRFRNDTGAWLLMQATADPRTAVAEVTLYGTKMNRTVSITHEITKRTPPINKPEYYGDPEQPVGTMKRTDTARGGMTIDVYRTITENGVAHAPELFRTVFQPWSNKYAVNPADLGADGIPVFLAQPTVTPTADPALAPTADPNAAPAQPTSGPAVWQTVDPATLPTVDPAIVGTPVPSN